jgi:hypothetical protein
MQHAELIYSQLEGNTSTAGRCSLCYETFSASPSAATDPTLGKRELRDLFDGHVRARHGWRADANQTGAFRLRRMTEEFGS